MARADVTFAESAVRDLEAILAWYERERAPEVGRRLVADIVDSAEALASHPDMGRVVPEFGQLHLRELIRPPFRIVYRREKRKVRVVRIWRSERLLTLDEQ